MKVNIVKYLDNIKFHSQPALYFWEYVKPCSRSNCIYPLYLKLKG